MIRRAASVLILSLGIMLGIGLTSPAPVSAAVAAHCDGSRSFLGFPTWYKYLDIGGDECDIIGPTAEDSTPEKIKIDWQKAGGRIALAIIEILLRVAALVAVAFVMYGGFRYITSQGDPEGAKNARQTIINSLIGLSISLVATAAVAFIANELTK